MGTLSTALATFARGLGRRWDPRPWAPALGGSSALSGPKLARRGRGKPGGPRAMGEVEACSPAPCVGQRGARGPGSPVPVVGVSGLWHWAQPPRLSGPGKWLGGLWWGTGWEGLEAGGGDLSVSRVHGLMTEPLGVCRSSGDRSPPAPSRRVLHWLLPPPPEVGRGCTWAGGEDLRDPAGPRGPCLPPPESPFWGARGQGVHRMWLSICPPPISRLTPPPAPRRPRM